MGYVFENGRLRTRSLEYSAAYHCNLRCACCSHASPYVLKGFPDVESFRADLAALGAALRTDVLRILGGEPLLNPEVAALLRAARRSRIAARVMVTTNGLLLHEMADAFWENVDLVLVIAYPETEPRLVREPTARPTTRESHLDRHVERMRRLEAPLRKHTWFTEGISGATFRDPGTLGEGLLERYGIDACILEFNCNWIAGLERHPSAEAWEEFGRGLRDVFREYFE